MRKTTIMIPAAMHRRASERAREKGVSLAALVRQLLETEVEVQGPAPKAKKDPIFRRHPYRGAAPRDGAANHDKYLYDEP